MEGYSKDQEASQPAYPPQSGYAPQPGYGQPPSDPAYPPAGYGYSNQPAQPPPNYGQTIPASTAGVHITTVSQASPPNYLGLALFVTFCCFWPTGICAIVKSTEVNNAFARGDHAGAKAASDSARKLSYISIGCGIASIVISVVFVIIYYVVIAASISSSY